MSPSSNSPQRSGPGIPASGLEAKRESVLDRLTEAFAADLVPLPDYESRVTRAQNARTAAELEAALDGLPAASAPERAGGTPQAPLGGRQPSPLPSNPIDPSIAGPSSVACIMGDRTLTGDWLSGDQVSAFTCMGSTKLDLRDTALPPDRLKIDTFAFMGEIKIFVPRGLPVRMNVFPFMGEAKASGPVVQRITPGMPYLEVSGLAFMGSIVVVAMD